MDYSSIETLLTNNNTFQSYSFENLDWKSWGRFTNENWQYPLYAGFIYITLIFGIQHFMKNLKPFVLKQELFLWNAGLGIYSILALSRVVIPSIHRVFSKEDGIYESVCIANTSMPVVFWSITFTISKFIELGDTIFIVLRKKPLQFIQWFHHITTLSVTWFINGYFEPVTQVCITINLLVHSLMYPYFALRTMDVKIPKSVANFITTLQLLQMFFGFGVNFYTGYLYYSGAKPCLRYPISITLYTLLYGSFVILFGKLFYDLVVVSKKRTKKAE